MSDLKPTVLLILDGWGYAPASAGNAVTAAKTPCLDELLNRFPWCLLQCSGQAVGLPQGQMGNSEVGHLNIGAGRVVDQDIVRIDKSIRDSSFFENKTLIQLFEQAISHSNRVHLMGLVSDGGVHSHMDHILALLKMAREYKIGQVFIHAFMDGRDTPPTSGQSYIQSLAKSCQEIGIGRIASVCGRYYAMDRDKRWDRIELAYKAIVSGVGQKSYDPVQAVKQAYDRGETDEFVTPTVIVDAQNQPVGQIEDGDALFLFNFRADRARQLVQCLSSDKITEFDDEQRYFHISYLATMTEYDPKFKLPNAFVPLKLINILAEVCAGHGLGQFRIAETEKYAHVTYFFNGGLEDPFRGEVRRLVPSPKEVDTYDQKPEMSVFKVTEKLCAEWHQGYSLIVCNFANLDMVGHTGNFSAAVKACQAVDSCVGKVMKEVLKAGGRLLITADHGNAEMMLDDHGNIHTAHSQSPVPFLVVEKEPLQLDLRSDGCLGDIAPTVLDLWNISQPEEMTGQSLIDHSR